MGSRKTSGYQREKRSHKYHEQYYEKQIQSQSPRGMPVMTLKRRLEGSMPQHNLSSPRQSILNTRNNHNNVVGSQVISKKTTEDAIVQEAYNTMLAAQHPNMQRINTLAKVRIKVKGLKNQIASTNESVNNETSMNAHSTSYGGGQNSPKQDNSGQRNVSLNYNLSKGRDGRTRITSTKNHNKAVVNGVSTSPRRMQSSVHRKAANKSLNKGSKVMKKAIMNNSNIMMQHVQQVPLHIFSTNAVSNINQKNFKEDEEVPYSSNRFIQQSTQNNQLSILKNNHLISQDVSIHTLPVGPESRTNQITSNSPEILLTQQPSRNHITGENEDQTGLQYMMAPSIGQTGLILNVESPRGRQGLQESQSWNIQKEQAQQHLKSLKRQALQETLSKQIGSQTFAQKQTTFHQQSNNMETGPSNEQFQPPEKLVEEEEQESDANLKNNFAATATSIFDHTTLQEMPSVVRQNHHQLNGKAQNAQQMNIQNQQQSIFPPTITPLMPQINQPQVNNTYQGIGFVNYVNGVPVSIQLNQQDLIKSSGLGNVPRSSFSKKGSNAQKGSRNLRTHLKTDLDKKSRVFNNNLYLQNKINQNIAEVQAKQGQYLPIIDTTGIIQSKPFQPTSVKPDFYKFKRKKQNLTMLRGIYKDGFDGYRQNQISMNDQDSSFHLPYRIRDSLEFPDDDTLTGLTLKDQSNTFQSKGPRTRKSHNSTKQSYETKKQLKSNYMEIKNRLRISQKHDGRVNTKSPSGDTNRSHEYTKLKEPENKEIQKKAVQTAKAGFRQSPYPAIQKNISTSQALKRNYNRKSPTNQNSRQLMQTLQDGTKNSSFKNLNNVNMEMDEYGGHPISIDLNNTQTSGYRPSDFGQQDPFQKQFGGTNDNSTSPIRVQGHKDQGPSGTQKHSTKKLDRQVSNMKRQQSVEKIKQLPVKERMEKIRWPGVNQSKTFEKVPLEPSLFKMKVPREDMEHLIRDDLDEMSKLEVIYKVLKNQLRQHQQTLIKMKEQEKRRKLMEKEEREKAEKEKRSPRLQGDEEDVDLKEFAKYMKPFEWYGPQRDLSPELKRIVKNLTCQEHKYVYCPTCKKYDEVEHDPLDNIKKFMKFIKDEQQKLYSPFKKTSKKDLKEMEDKLMPDDSIGDITDLEEEEILAKYLKSKRTEKQQKKRELMKNRASAQQRLTGEVPNNRHVCKNHRVLSEEEKQIMAVDDTVVLELRKPDKPPEMHDEEQSAHQFSVKEQSAQADSEERLDIEMRASRYDESKWRKHSLKRTDSKKSHIQTINGSYEILPRKDSKESLAGRNRSKTDKKSKKMKSPERDISLRSQMRSIDISPKKTSPLKANGKLKDNATLFKPLSEKSEMAVQTDFGKHQESKKGIRFEDPVENSEAEEDDGQPFENKPNFDKYKEDWADSIVYKKAMKAEAIKRGLPYQEYEVDDDEEAYDLKTEFNQDEGNIQDAQDASNRQHEIGFMKKLGEKGNIQMLSESEVHYLKTLLKQEAEKWERKSTLSDIYRHSKFTIRMLTRKMARVDNKNIFRKNRQATRDNTIQIIYRAELLYAAKGDATKFFQNMAKYIFDYSEFDRIIDLAGQLDPKEEKFIRQREHLIKRLLSQINNFLSQYKIFNNQFIFKQVNIYEYLSAELEKVLACKSMHEGIMKKQILHLSTDKVYENTKKIIEPKRSKKASGGPGGELKLDVKNPYNKTVYKIDDEKNSSSKINDIMSAKISEMMKSARSQRIRGDGSAIRNVGASHRSKLKSARVGSATGSLEAPDGRRQSQPTSVEKDKSIN